MMLSKGKRFLGVLLCTAMVFSSLPLATLATEGGQFNAVVNVSLPMGIYDDFSWQNESQNVDNLPIWEGGIPIWDYFDMTGYECCEGETRSV